MFQRVSFSLFCSLKDEFINTIPFQISHWHITTVKKTKGTIRCSLHPSSSPHGHLVHTFPCKYVKVLKSISFSRWLKLFHFKEDWKQGSECDVEVIEATLWNNEATFAPTESKMSLWTTSCPIQEQCKTHPAPGTCNVRLMSTKTTVCASVPSSHTESWN